MHTYWATGAGFSYATSNPYVVGAYLYAPAFAQGTKVHMVHLVYLVRCDDSAPVPGSEMLEARFFPPDALPEPMHSGHGQRLPFCIDLARTGQTHTDPATTTDATDLPTHQRPDH